MPEIFDKITDQTKKLKVENITKKEGFPLDISVMVHDHGGHSRGASSHKGPKRLYADGPLR